MSDKAVINEPKIDPKEILEGIVEWISIESPSHDAKACRRSAHRHRRMGVDREPEPRRQVGQQGRRPCRGAVPRPRAEARAHSRPRRLRRHPGVQDAAGDEPGRRQGHPGAGPSRYRASHRHDREGPEDPPRRRQHLRARHLRHEGGRLHRLLRAAPSDAPGQEDQAAGHLPVHPRGGGRQPDLAGAHRRGGARPQICAGHGARPRRRSGRHVAQGRRPLQPHGEGHGEPCRRAPPGRPQRHPRDGQADHAHRGQDRLCPRHHLQCRPDPGRHRRQRRARRVQGRGRPARAEPAARRGDDALVPEPRADRQGRRR